MEHTKATVEALNDLILINNDRIKGLEHAISQLEDKDADLKNLLVALVGESHQFKMELATEVAALGKDIETGTSTSGTLHRNWLDVKAAFTGHSKRSILEECEFGEDAILKAYKTALADENVPAYVKDILVKQEQILQAAHDKVKALGDSVL
jgi:uncharacterized protein (TIGR02284 family)